MNKTLNKTMNSTMKETMKQRESEKLALEASMMDQKLQELKAAMSFNKEKRKVESGRIWASSGKDVTGKGGKPKAITPQSTTSTNASTKRGTRGGTPPQRPPSVGRRSSGPPSPPQGSSFWESSRVAQRGARRAHTTSTSPLANENNTTTGVGSSPPAPLPRKGRNVASTPSEVHQSQEFHNVMNRINSFSLSCGDFTSSSGEDSPEDPQVNEYLEQARSQHAEAFEEIEEFKYDEEEQRRAFHTELQQKRLSIISVTSTPKATDAGGGAGHVRFTPEIDGGKGGPAKPQPLQKPMKVTCETSTSPTVDEGRIGFNSADPKSTSTCEIQTMNVPNPRWEAFVGGLKRATEFNYFDHLMEQMQRADMLEKARAYQMRMSIEGPLAS
uniref:Uncharacterized protein n=1 Tax=Eutreptiella gymnastica TaxID=73025 RepID=A0A7S1JEV2_9EUGL|mmetsp:Transcript_9192/g.16323  ORF Transcript_9192/g.16323 Transcript_9192/m.16323 type:complete len:385 (+) Transcript_9192:146-1300(+)